MSISSRTVVPITAPPQERALTDVVILVDAPAEILAAKLTTLLSRSETRDIGDALALIRHGVDLRTAIADAAAKDTGFSPLTLAWVLRHMDLKALGRSEGLSEEEVASVHGELDELIRAIVEATSGEAL